MNVLVKTSLDEAIRIFQKEKIKTLSRFKIFKTANPRAIQDNKYSNLYWIHSFNDTATRIWCSHSGINGALLVISECIPQYQYIESQIYRHFLTLVSTPTKNTPAEMQNVQENYFWKRKHDVDKPCHGHVLIISLQSSICFHQGQCII